MQGDTQTATYIGWHDDSIDIFHKRCLPRGGGGVEEASQVTHTTTLNMLNHVGFFGGVFQQLRPHSFFFLLLGHT